MTVTLTPPPGIALLRNPRGQVAVDPAPDVPYRRLFAAIILQAMRDAFPGNRTAFADRWSAVGFLADPNVQALADDLFDIDLTTLTETDQAEAA